MEIWSIWIDWISSCLHLLTSEVGLSEAFAIVTLTLAVRMLLLPVSFKAAYEAHKTKRAMEKIKPEIEQLRATLKDDAPELARRTMALYREHGIRVLSKTTLLNLGSQSVFGLGLMQALRRAIFNSKFMWIANIGKPDIVLSLLVGMLTFASMLAMPGATQHTSMLILLVPAVISILTLLSFPSALGLYWATSSVVSTAQSVALRACVRRSERMNEGLTA